ncbi:MAG TPA: permease-like cell division protein FtsX [bacterium]|nr:permease-like cell division protein FtsX [bacterium]HPT29884.1 permease-like cell division protein FtsX [bacterium]
MTSFWRILKFSFQDVSRNIWLSIATITILVLALFSVNVLLTVQALSQNAINAIKDKVNISLYLRPEASEAEILDLKTKLAALPEVREIGYISKVEALDSFRERNKNNPEIFSALRELGKNPLSPSLVISPKDSDQADVLIEQIKKNNNPIIESRDFTDNALLLEKITQVTKKVNEVGFFIIAIFILTSMLVAYNSIKVAIYTHRREVEIMRLVGASNRFIHQPFLFSAVFYALAATIIGVALFFPFLGLLQPYLEVFFLDYQFNIVHYFISNSWLIFGSQFLAMALINVVASSLAIRRYTKV